MKRPAFSLKTVLPFAVLALSMLASSLLFVLRADVKPQEPDPVIPEVDVWHAEPRTLRLNVTSQGVVTPREEIDLVSEVAGKVVQAHSALVSGGFFKSGEVLLTIDPRDYDYDIVAAQARIAEAKRVLISEQAQVAQAQSEWQALGQGEASELALRKPQLAEAEAKLQAAQADLAKAKLNRSRCELRAPFAGRVLTKQAGVGQFLAAGSVVARIYASDVAEVRLPVSNEQLAFLNVPLSQSNAAAQSSPVVTIRAELAGRQHQWSGRIVRSEAALSDDSSQWYLVAQFANPFQSIADKPPLLKGLFVQAEIEGAERSSLYRLPRIAVSPRQTVTIVNREQRLEIRPVQVLRSDAESSIVDAGLNPGDRVVISELPMAIAGTPVKVRND